MKRYSKLIAVPVAAAISGVITPIIMSFLPETFVADPDFASNLEYLIHTILIGGGVWAAPKNAE